MTPKQIQQTIAKIEDLRMQGKNHPSTSMAYIQSKAIEEGIKTLLEILEYKLYTEETFFGDELTIVSVKHYRK